ncbi:galactosylceramide sulfotransferase-like [Petromyzon marinus]|uniref:galactosylceramide sulfotransferase-like n=1 Tax=Petromyzon marinus TaxID=7757 RepID=UPI003F70F0D3
MLVKIFRKEKYIHPEVLHTDIVFLKTHKTASSTFQNILFRFGEKHNLTFAFPYMTYQFIYPHDFMASFVAPLPLRAAGGRFHILSSHMRFQKDEVARVMSPMAMYLSIVRRPENNFESVFYYYESVVSAFDAAGKHSYGRDHLKTFLENAETFYKLEKMPTAFVRNPMAFDFGLTPNISVSSDEFATGLAELDAKFDLVMITERFDESMILAKEMLGWEMEDVVYLSTNKRAKTHTNKSFKRKNQHLTEMIRRWNALDVALYEHFARRFQRQVEAFGVGRMQREVDALRRKVSARREECVANEVEAGMVNQSEIMPFIPGSVVVLGYNMRSGLNLRTRERCLRMLLPELKYHTRLFQRQYGSTVEEYNVGAKLSTTNETR